MKDGTDTAGRAVEESPAPDGFLCRRDDPLFTEQGLLTQVLLSDRRPPENFAEPRKFLPASDAKKAIFAADPPMRARVIDALTVRLLLIDGVRQQISIPSVDPDDQVLNPSSRTEWHRMMSQRAMFVELLKMLLLHPGPVTTESYHRLIRWCLDAGSFFSLDAYPAMGLYQAVVEVAKREGLTPENLELVTRVKQLVGKYGVEVDWVRRFITQLDTIEREGGIQLEPGEAWSDAAIEFVRKTSGDQYQAWISLLTACRKVTGGAPSSKWLKAAKALVDRVGEDHIREALVSWFPLTAAARTQRAISELEWLERCMYGELSRHCRVIYEGLNKSKSGWEHQLDFVRAARKSGDVWKWLRTFAYQSEVRAVWHGIPPTLDVPAEPPPYDAPEEKLLLEAHMDILRGLAWVAGLLPGPDTARALTALALSAYRKVPGKGPRAVRVGNACITALSLMGGLEAVGQLAVLKVKVKFGTAQAQIEKALLACAAKSGVPRDELEEMSVPAYGLTEVGRGVEPLGAYSAELLVHGIHDVALVWRDPDGKERKALPAGAKEEFKEEIKEITAAKKDIERMLPAQAERLDSLFLAQKSWPLEFWLEHYLQHPLVGVLTRQLIWNFSTAGASAAGIWHHDKLTDHTGAPVPLDPALTRVSLWHPLGRPVDEILAWRSFLAEHQVRQPFKQAWRELYILTPAEMETAVYSNRFAAHILRQHQFNALCAARGWKNKLRLVYDNDYPATSRTLPGWNLRAEFWVEIAGEETSDSGVSLHLATDQVRFYRADAAQPQAHAYGGGYTGGGEPLRLVDIPPLVLSEIMRDVDLFVGVASVGNDPYWRDGGLREQFANQWQHFAFGDLTATAQTRRSVLEALVPKLKIAAQCSFEDKFLLVRGSLHTYKIHLGSGNILMSPNDQYLCIVGARGKADTGNAFLPFEGDATLSLILSKAILLAADHKIVDPDITRQL